MKSTLLIVTPQASFGVFIRDGLDPSRFDAFFTSDFSDAIHYVHENNCPTVLLDTELEDVELSVMDIGFALRQIKPDIQFVVVVRAGQDVDTASLSPVATITKPIELPDLSRLLERLAVPDSIQESMDTSMSELKIPERPIDESSRLMWLTDVSKAAQQLTQLTLESSAQAAFITRQNELWAYAGQLSREAAQELTDSIQRYWDTEGESDLLRFVRLQATEAQHMLYVRKLSENMTLALVFDAETPFSTIRSQAGKLVKNLFESSYDEMGGQVPAPESSHPAPTPNYELLDKGDYQDIPPISELLGEVPPPIPPRPTLNINLPWDQPSPTSPVAPTNLAETVIGIYLSKPQTQPVAEPDNLVSNESSPPVRRGAQKRPMPAMDETFASQPLESDKLVDLPRIGIPEELQMTRKQEHFDPESIVETRAQASVAESITDVAHRILLESPSLSQVNLTYACLLIPRFEHHHLVGDAAARLNEWVPQLCVAFGWRLEYISVRPDYLQWITRVPLNTAAGYVINTIRKHTSERYFAEFPRFKADNPSGEFWARGFIVQGGSQPHPQKLIRDFIKQTRMRQGLR
jgi:REP element-mobilizing transposase RayT/DNA-binding response OmpR family regulator